MSELIFNNTHRSSKDRFTGTELGQLELTYATLSTNASWSKKLLVLSKEHFELFPLGISFNQAHRSRT
jgi:hypothetical protein